MRRLTVFLAVAGMIATPMAPVRAQETADIYSKDGITGPSFARSTQCAAVYVLTMQMLGSAQQGYQNALKQATAWLSWANTVSEGRDGAAEMNRRKDAFTAQTQSMDNDEYNEAIGTELKTCLTIKGLFDGVEPFSSDFAEAVATAGNSEEAQKPDFLAAVDCVATYSIIAQVVGEEDPNYKWFDDGLNIWSQYAVSVFNGSEKQAVKAATDRAKLMSDDLVKQLNNDQEAGLATISANRDRCIELEKVLPDHFSGR